mmetsp:Transcript_93991/g.242874  ORF Transcript_93991/g.242874 Transcript_93991/m.242874 type:complete len:110 (-) Transcript_93991:37-366(-)
MAVQLWMVVAGAAMMVHAGLGLLAEKQAAALLAEEPVGPFSSGVFLEVVVGAALALWGGIGEFKPIRICDSKKPRWESLHARPDFHCYLNRGKLIRPLLEGVLPTPPED